MGDWNEKIKEFSGKKEITSGDIDEMFELAGYDKSRGDEIVDSVLDRYNLN